MIWEARVALCQWSVSIRPGTRPWQPHVPPSRHATARFAGGVADVHMWSALIGTCAWGGATLCA